MEEYTIPEMMDDGGSELIKEYLERELGFDKAMKDGIKMKRRIADELVDEHVAAEVRGISIISKLDQSPSPLTC